ncbi:MAG: YciI family protein [Dissulfurispiraceae bacterium]|jgi:uncharacterized protein YciI
MFVILVNYIKPLTEIDANLEAHRRFLDEGYAAGYLLASGPRVPRTGGILLAQAPSIDELKAYLSRDPFNEAGVAQYKVLEFEPTKSDPRVKAIIK